MATGAQLSLVEELPLPYRFALAYSPQAVRPQWLTLLALDTRLSRIVANATEPMLAQMRLAWWRGELDKSRADRPQGDALLDLIGESWAVGEAALIPLVDGWEHLLAEGRLSSQNAKDFVDGRAEAISGIGSTRPYAAAGDAVFAQARFWAAVDLLGSISHQEERATVGAMIEGFSTASPRLPRSHRPLAVLSGLSRRAYDRGEPQILGSRASVVAGLRFGLLGR